jgi:hypothetical protein
MYEQQTITLWPKCGSSDLNFDSMSLGEFSLSNRSMNYYCRNCNYGKYVYNSVFPEVHLNDVEEFRKRINKYL